MKNEHQRRNKLNISSECDCVNCDKCHPKVIEDENLKDLYSHHMNH